MKNREQNTNIFDVETLNLLRPETELEHNVVSCDEFKRGLDWGVPRYGHPEGKVLYHVREVLDNIEKIETLSDIEREELRIITFAHDTFKYKEDKTTRPRDWSRHHGMLARKYMEKFLTSKPILDIVELHDEAYYCWRHHYLYNQSETGEKRLDGLLLRLNGNLQLFYIFFKCDTRTGDKIQSPVTWFEQEVRDIDIVDF